MSYRKGVFMIATLAMGLTASVAVLSQTATTAPKPAAKNASGEVKKIVLPQYSPEIPKGPNVETYRKDCLTCHTARYVLMQPHFSKTVWQNEVKKMVDVYGAPVPEADQPLIVDYLVAVKGVDAPAAPTSTK
jgi:cytochrome c5